VALRRLRTQLGEKHVSAHSAGRSLRAARRIS
jgi:hypothetical protein